MRSERPPLFAPAYPLRGASFLFRHPSLWRYVAIPTLAAILLYGLAGWSFIHGVSGWTERFAQSGETWYGEVLQRLFLGVLALAYLLFTVYTYAIVNALLFAPFADGFSARVEELLTGRREDAQGFAGSIRGAWQSFVSAAKRLLLYFAGFCLLLVLLFVPGLGQVAYTVMALPYTMFFLAWEFLDSPMDRHGYDFAKKLSAVTRNFAGVLGFGAGAWVLFLVPLAGLFAVPACVAGSTIYFCDLRGADRLPAPPGGESPSSLPEKPA
jgi:CysZ protein